MTPIAISWNSPPFVFRPSGSAWGITPLGVGGVQAVEKRHALKDDKRYKRRWNENTREVSNILDWDAV
jgi:hypothetical protein